LLLTVFFAATMPLLIRNKWWWRNSLAVIFGTLLIVLPLTLRNAIVFHRFIPLSLGAGQTLLEGIADYDDAGRFNVPKTDLGIMRQEAEAFQRPDYKNGLLSPDGIQRERWRLQRGLRVISSHPLWFGGVMIRRAGSMVRLERARLVSINPAVTYPLHLVDQSSIVSTTAPANLLAMGSAGSAKIKTSLSPDGQILSITGDDSSYGTQFIFPPTNVRAHREYVFKLPIRIVQGRMKIAAIDGSGGVQSTVILENAEGATPTQSFKVIHVPFTTNSDGEMRLALSNEASNQFAAMQIGTTNLYDLGAAQHAWTRYPRLLIHGIQKLMITAIILPLALIGLAFLIIRKRRDVLIILSLVPLYYFCVQSIFHTEYRYVLAVSYFLFALSAVAVCWIGNLIVGKLRFGKQHKGELTDPVATPTSRGSDSAQVPARSVR
jgi:hypothetical protein